MNDTPNWNTGFIEAHRSREPKIVTRAERQCELEMIEQYIAVSGITRCELAGSDAVGIFTAIGPNTSGVVEGLGVIRSRQ